MPARVTLISGAESVSTMVADSTEVAVSAEYCQPAGIVATRSSAMVSWANAMPPTKPPSGHSQRLPLAHWQTRDATPQLTDLML
jgi:hypothetical protein